MEPHEHRQKHVESLMQHIEEMYQDLLNTAGAAPGNALMRHIYLTEAIDVMSSAPDHDPLMKQMLLLRLYTMRSEIATDAEFLKIVYEK